MKEKYNNNNVLTAIECAEKACNTAEELMVATLNLFISVMEQHEAGEDLPSKGTESENFCVIRKYFEDVLSDRNFGNERIVYHGE